MPARRPRSLRRPTKSHTGASPHNRYAPTSRPSSQCWCALRLGPVVGAVNAPARVEPAFWTLLPELYGFVSTERRRHLHLLLGLMFVGAAAELATLGSLLPFLSL